jgi:valyl-tRNA synthetase
VAAERGRLQKNLGVTEKELAQVTTKLDNADFVAKAPDAVVDKMRRRQAEATAEIGRLREQLAALPDA